jgi:hypothetical protein
VNNPVSVPPDIVQVGPEATGGPVKEQVESLGAQPEPVTFTVAPIWPEVGVSVIVAVGPVTVNEAEAESPPGAPVTVTVYEIRLAEVETVNEPEA